MKKRVVLSAYCIILTIITLVVLAGVCAVQIRNNGFDVPNIILVSIIAAVCLVSLWFAPMWIKLDAESVKVGHLLGSKDIPLSEIASVELCPPTMAEWRICGSGGFMGYWGYFRENSIGKYVAYYGKASDCFLVTLKDGRKYMLGCKDAPEMVAGIKESLGLD